MKIIKEFIIDRLECFRGDRYDLHLDNSLLGQGQSCMSLSKGTIRPSAGLLKKKIVCEFISRTLVAETGAGGWLFANFDAEDLIVHALSKQKSVTPHYNHIPYCPSSNTNHLLHLGTAYGGGSIVLVPCPCYEFSLSLTPEEYIACQDIIRQPVVFRLTWKITK